jgi:Arylsulfotransferase (ASST)
MIRRTCSVAVLILAACSIVVQSASARGSARAPSAVTISPLPGTPTAPPQTQISFLGAGSKSLSAVSVVGSSSGRHRGRLRPYASATGASFVPSTPFTPGEQVSVSARWHVGKRTKRLTSTFTVAQPGAISLVEFTAPTGKPTDIQNFISEPALHPPAITVTRAASGASAPGYLFSSPFFGPGQPGPMIFDSAGNVVWFRAVAGGEDAADFRTQVYQGKTDLTWWQGKTYNLGFGHGVDIVANSNYKTVATIKAGNGLQADEHEFLLGPQRGTAWVLAYNPVLSSLAPAGGPASGSVLDGVIQQIDIRTGLVMWEWHSLGHVDVSESYSKPPNTPANPYDYFHVNSLDVSSRGEILAGARNTWALYDINPHTGAIVWRLGGKKTTFALGPGVQFADQHNGLWLANGEISLFDDEGAPPVKPPSRGEIVKLDLKAKTATLASQFLHAPAPLLTGSQGNLQALPGGRWLVGWGGLPNSTEFNAAGEVIYDAQLPTVAPMGEFSYRTYREPWSGRPSTPPAIVAKAAPTRAVYASWNGATEVASWQLLTGTTAAHLSPVSTTPKTGFETVIPAPAAAFYEVRALSPSGSVLGTSAPVAPS